MEDFVTFELAKKLKENGFDYPCIAHYDINKELKVVIREPIFWHSDVLSYTDAPTISQALKWLREEKKIHIEPCILADADTDADGEIINEYAYWSFSVTNIETVNMIYFEYEHLNDRRFDSYEQAALAGIEYVLDNLI